MTDRPGRVHDEGTYQMLWDCKFCGTTKLLGVNHRHCPNCGAAQDPAWRYFPAEEDMIALEDHKYVGADKTCPACSQPNSAASEYCTSCGADLATGQIVQARGARALGTAGATELKQDVVKEQFQKEMKRVKDEERAKPVFLGLKRTELIVVGVVLLVAALIVGIIFALTYSKSVSGEVKAMAWERVIQIEENNPQTVSAFRDQKPAGGYNERNCRNEKRQERKQVGTEKQCRDVDQGDGSMKRVCDDKPVYENVMVDARKCDYTVDRWSKIHEYKASGAADMPPAWSAEGLNYSLASDERSSKSEKYTLVIRADGEDKKCEYEKQAEWDKFKVGMAVTLKTGITGSPKCDTVKPK